MRRFELFDGANSGRVRRYPEKAKGAIRGRPFHYSRNANERTRRPLRLQCSKSLRVPYSLTRHLARAILFGRFSESAPVTMFTAYFDTSGTKRMRVLTVAGFVSHVKRWDRFDRKWSEILDRFGVTSFHMTDFVASTDGFRRFKGKSELRRTFISELVDCIRKETKRGFASSVILADFEEVNRDYQLIETVGTPYALCATCCLGGLEKWILQRKHDKSKTLVFFEDGDEDKGDTIARARLHGYIAATLPKASATAFQAGDLAGWKCRTVITNALDQPLESVEDGDKILRSLDPIKGIVHNNGVFNAEALLMICNQARIPLRLRSA